LILKTRDIIIIAKYRTMNPIKIAFILLSAFGLSHSRTSKNPNINLTRSIKQKQVPKVKLLEKKYTPKEYILESWDDGEVSWELEPYNYIKNENPVVLANKNEEIVLSNREKIWGLLEELRIQGVISGFLNIAYYNTAVSDNIINDFQNIDLKQNDNLSSALSKNFNSELDVLFTILTIISYKKYQETRITEFIKEWGSKNKNNYYVNEYRRTKKLTTIFTLCFIVIFCKSVKSAS